MDNPVAVKWTTAGLVTIIAALAIALVIKSTQGTPEPKIPPALQHELDSLRETKPAFDAHQDSVIRITVRDTTAAKKANARADSSKRSADSLQVIADSLRKVASVSADTADYRKAIDAQRHVSDSLRVALASKDSAYRVEKANTVRLLFQLDSTSRRNNAIDDANAKLQKRIAELEVPCRIVGPVPCPSRTVTMVLTTVVVTAAENATRRH